jgi:site-specific DNA recombinase
MAERRQRQGSVVAPAGGAIPARRVIRCAIYTRKSSEEGLEQEFNSLQAQREACAAYIASQRHEGWQLSPVVYDDGGYSGGSMERPGLIRLMADVEAGQVDIVVVYKVDRLTRALTDFARIIEAFDQKGVSFVSVTQSFNTTSSMGRLTLNVLLSFAQFEREVTAERIRDKIAASKRKGLWMGGTLSFGYRVEDRKLVIVEEEAATVRMIFALYRELGAISATVAELERRGIVTRVRPLATGQTIGGIPFRSGSLQALLRNRAYVGELFHKGLYHPGEHPPILDCALFAEVQAMLDRQRRGKTRSVHRMAALLLGKIEDSRGHPMVPTHTRKGNIIYRYYQSKALIDGRKFEAGDPSRVAAHALEQQVITALRDWIASHASSNPLKAAQLHQLGLLDPDLTDATRIGRLLARGIIHREAITLLIREPGPSRQTAEDMTKEQMEGTDSGRASPDDDSHLIRLTIPCTLIRAASGYQRIDPTQPDLDLTAGSDRAPPAPDRQAMLERQNRERLVTAIARAHRWKAELRQGIMLDTIATREGRSARNVRMMLNLAYLAPDLTEAALDHRLPAGLTASGLAQGLPLNWTDQRRWILGSAPNT